MSLKMTFLAVENADSLVVCEDERAGSLVLDAPNFRKIEHVLHGKGVQTIDWLVITHDHDDHFAGLVDAWAFVNAWCKEERAIRLVVAPRGLWEDARKKLKTLKESDHLRYLRLQAAIDGLRGSHDRQEVRWESWESPRAEEVGAVSLHVLHPDYMDNEELTARPNERSLVLHLRYGQFAALLLADVEGEGCMRLVQRSRGSRGQSVRSTLLKIPHHGAMPASKSGQEALVELLREARPELAILSVGSRNRHHHVRPELFHTLRQLKEEARLGRFICTEVTRTCALTPAERLPLGRGGLPARLPCAGDIEVVADLDGSWRLPRDAAHQVRIADVPYAACTSRACLFPEAGAVPSSPIPATTATTSKPSAEGAD